MNKNEFSPAENHVSRGVKRACGVILAVMLSLNTALFVHRPAAWADEVDDANVTAQTLDGTDGTADGADGAADGTSDANGATGTDDAGSAGTTDGAAGANGTGDTTSPDANTNAGTSNGTNSTNNGTNAGGDTDALTDPTDTNSSNGTDANASDSSSSDTDTKKSSDDTDSDTTDADSTPSTQSDDHTATADTTGSTTIKRGTTGRIYLENLALTDVAAITFSNTIDVPSDATATWNAADDGTAGVTAWAVPSTTVSGKYDVTYASDGVYPSISSGQSLFANFSILRTITNLDKVDTSTVTSMRNMFDGCERLRSVDVSGFDTSNVTTMYSMFQNCENLTSLDVSGFDTSNVTNMGYMFRGCSSLTTLDVSGFDTSNVTTMGYMFYGCSRLTSLDVSGFDTSNVKNMRNMFANSYRITSLDVSGFDTSNVTDMYSMFSGCQKLTSLDVSGFDTSNVTTMYSMFSGCQSLTSLDVSHWNTAKNRQFNYMFSGCQSLTSLDVSNFDISNATYINTMFQDCTSLTTLNLGSWKFPSRALALNQMFLNCRKLTSLDLSSWNTSYIYAATDMLSGLTSLSKLVLGSGFTFNGSTTSHLNTRLGSPYSPSKTGYHATNKWMNEATGTVYDAPDDIPNGDSLEPAGAASATYVPNYEANTYTVAFEAGATDATGTMADESFTYDQAQKLTKNTFTRDGYTFTGWKDANGKTYTDEQSVKNLSAEDGATITLTAQWTAHTYTVKFEAGATDATGSMADESFTYDEAKVLTKNAFARDGYTFVGWKGSDGKTYTDEQSVKNLTAKDGDTITLTAQWKAAEYSITYDLNGGTLDQANPDHYTYGEGVDSFNSPTRTGYTFDGWKDADGNIVTSITKTDKGDKHLTAQWKAHGYSVRFAPGATGVSGSMTDELFTYDIEQALTKNAFTRDGYTFTGWKDAQGSTYTDGQSVKNLTAEDGEVVTLTAQWKANEYQITYDLNGGTLDQANPDHYTYGVGVDSFNSPTRTGYTFDGWKDADGKTVTSITKTDLGDKHLTAQWKANTYTVKFEAGASDATGTMADESFTYDQAQKLTKNAFARDGYTFTGWKGSDGKTYTDAQEVKNLTTTDGGEITLTAQWKANAYTVKFDKGATDATGSMADETFAYDQAQKLTKNAFARDGYTFTGWKDANGKTYTDEQEVKNLTTADGGEVTLTAQWSAHAYTVKFDKGADNAQGTMSDETFTYDQTKALTKNAYTRDGYTFDGWKGSDGKTYTDAQQVKNLTAEDNGSVTLTAQWKANGYTVKFDKGATDAKGTMSDETFTYDQAKALTKNAYTRDGYTFTGWKDAQGSTYADEQDVKNLTTENNGKVTLTAQWKANDYQITYDLNGGTLDQANPDHYTYGVGVDSFNSPTRDGYTFTGWKDADGNTVTSITKTDLGDKHLTAQWKANTYTVKFEAGASDAQGTMADESFTYDEAKALTKNAYTRDGYTFTGWKDANGKTYTDEQSVKNLTTDNGGSVTLTAQWTANKYTVKFDKGASDAQGTMADESFTYDEAKALTKNAYTRDGYTFTGWKDANGKTYTDEQEVKNLTTKADGEVTLTAQWTAHQYTVKFDKGASDAQGTMADESFTYDEAKALTKNAYTRDGYTFDGWKAADGSTYADEQDVKNLTSDNGGEVTLTAQWTANSYTVTFDKGATDAKGTMADESFTYDEAKALTKNAFTRDGYTFTGWKGSDGSTYADEQDVKNLTTENNGKVTLTAQWKANEYKITYDLNGGTLSEANPDHYTYGVGVDSFNSPTRDGYTFTGWKDADGNTVTSITKTDLGDKQLTAQWKANAYTVKFEAGAKDAKGTMADESFTYDEAKALTKNAYTRDGYTFTGWKDDQGNVYTDEQEVKNLTDANGGEVTLTAQWKANDYTVTFAPGATGVTGFMDDESFTYDEAKALTKNAYTRDGYTFTGWKDDQGNVYTDEQEVKNLIAENNGKVTLTAQWKANEYQITYDLGGGTLSEANPDHYTYGEGVDSFNAPTRDGYTFTGWKDADGNIVTSISKTDMGDKQLTAQWTKNEEPKQPEPQKPDTNKGNKGDGNKDTTPNNGNKGTTTKPSLPNTGSSISAVVAMMAASIAMAGAALALQRKIR